MFRMKYTVETLLSIPTPNANSQLRKVLRLHECARSDSPFANNRHNTLVAFVCRWTEYRHSRLFTVMHGSTQAG